MPAEEQIDQLPEPQQPQHPPLELSGADQLTVESWNAKWGLKKEDRELFSKEGLWASATGCDGMMFLWPCEHQADVPPCVRCFQVHDAICTDYVIDWDRMVTISVGGDCKVCLYDMAEDKKVGTIRNNTGVDITQIFLSVDGDVEVGKVAVGAAGGKVKIADVERQKIMFEIKSHRDDVYQVRVNWDTNQVVSCAWDCDVVISDIRTCKKVAVLKGHQQICNRMDVDFERQLAFSCGWEDQLILWDLREGQRGPIKCYPTPGHPANCVCVDWDHMIAASGADDGLVKLWDLESGECTQTIDCEHSQTLAIDVNWNRGLILTGSWDQKVKLFSLETGACLKEFKKARRVLTQCYIKPT